MAIHCDGCGAILKAHMGAAALRLSGPKPTGAHFLQAAKSKINLADFEVPDDIELDFCATCINKMFAAIGMDLRLATAFVMPGIQPIETASALTGEEIETLLKEG